MFLDGLPVGEPPIHHQLPISKNANVYPIGFRIGLIGFYAGTEDYMYYIYNHLVFTVKYHKDARTDSAHIVAFEVEPFSVKHSYEGKWDEKTVLKTCKIGEEEKYYSSGPQIVQDKEEIVFTYDVNFQESNITWASRWNIYHQVQADELYFYVVINHIVTPLFVLGVLSILMMRTYRDISKYNENVMREETGWKLVICYFQLCREDYRWCRGGGHHTCNPAVQELTFPCMRLFLYCSSVHNKASFDASLFWLHAHWLYCSFYASWCCWLLCMFLFH